jgi:hypothetical protein
MLDISVWHGKDRWETERDDAGERKNNPAPSIAVRLHIVTLSFLPDPPLDQRGMAELVPQGDSHRRTAVKRRHLSRHLKGLKGTASMVS